MPAGRSIVRTPTIAAAALGLALAAAPRSAAAAACCVSATSFGIGRLLAWEDWAAGVQLTHARSLGQYGPDGAIRWTGSDLSDGLTTFEPWAIVRLRDRLEAQAWVPLVVNDRWSPIDSQVAGGLGDAGAALRFEAIRIGEYAGLPSLAITLGGVAPTGRRVEQTSPPLFAGATGRGAWGGSLAFAGEYALAPWFVRLELGATAYLPFRRADTGAMQRDGTLLQASLASGAEVVPEGLVVAAASARNGRPPSPPPAPACRGRRPARSRSPGPRRGAWTLTGPSSRTSRTASGRAARGRTATPASASPWESAMDISERGFAIRDRSDSVRADRCAAAAGGNSTHRVLAAAAAVLACATASSGARAPATLALTAPDGTSTTLAELAAGREATVVVFWSASCPCVRRYQARTDALLDDWPAARVGVVGVSSNAGESYPDVLRAAAARGVRIPIFRDEGGRAAEALGVRSTPTVVVLDASARVRYLGWVDNERGRGDPGREPWLDRALAGVLHGTPFAARSPTYGCAITRSLFGASSSPCCADHAPQDRNDRRTP